MRTYNKAVEWVGFVIELGSANDIYINLYKLCDILFKANEVMKKIGVPLFREEPTPFGQMAIFESVKEKFYGFRTCPITIYDPWEHDVDLIQVNAIRKAMGLAVVRVDFE